MSADLVWDDPLRPEAGWQGIRNLVISFPTDDTASLDVVLFIENPAGAYEVTVSGPKELAPTISTGTGFSLVFPELGGRGTYFVTLTRTNPAEAPVHPFFATASFTFTIDCETGDCEAKEPSNPLRLPVKVAPAVDLLTKDFDGFLQLLADRVRVQNPDWRDFSPAAFERVLIELLAHHGDMLSYYQDRVANEAFLDTASQRFSVRQHGTLLGYELFDGEAATTVLSFEITDPPLTPPGSPFVAPAKLAVATERRVDEAPVVFSVTSDTLLTSTRNSDNLVAAQWPQAFTARVPAGATSMLLLGTQSALAPGQRIAFLQSGIPTQIRVLTAVEQPLSLPGWVDDPNNPLDETLLTAVTRIHWDEGLEFDLRVWDETLGDPRSVLEIHSNLVDARHGEWKKAQLLNAPTELDDEEPNISLTPQSAVIAEPPVPDEEAFPQLRSLRLPQGPVLFDRIDGLLVPAIELEIDNLGWFRQPHLQRSQPFDRHYVAASDNDGRVWLMFGDGRRGRPVELEQAPAPTNPDEPERAVSLELGTAKIRPGNELHVQFRIGPPLAGNVDIGKLTAVPPRQEFDDLDRIASVKNITPGTGGKDPESLDAARLAIPASLRTGDLQRAVTLEDYARLAELADPRVARAIAKEIGEPFSTVLVLVDPKDDAVLSDELRATLELALDRGRMVGREVLVRPAENVALDVEIAICAQTGFKKDEVKQAVLDALRPGDPERPGFFHPNRLNFGDDIELGDLIAETQRVPGVLAVKVTRFRRLLAVPPPEVLQRIGLGTTEVARLDADDTNPENGRLVVKVAGLDPLPDDLLLFAQSDDLRLGGAA